MIEAVATYPLSIWLIAGLVAFIAGLVKGIVGFAMPMILVSGLGAFLPPDIVVGGLILPTLVTNAAQALRHGLTEALQALRQFRVFLIVGGTALLFSAQLVLAIPPQVYLLIIGTPICLFVLAQIAGWAPAGLRRSARIEGVVGFVAGFMGGLSGIWGPPTVAYLTALDTPKQVQMLVQGVIYGLGALLLTLAHWGSGVLNAHTVWLSLGLVIPAGIGMLAGTAVQDRINQTLFRRATLLVLLLAGFNLVRRGLAGAV